MSKKKKHTQHLLEEEEQEAPSKSELKREMHALQKLGEAVVKLSNGDLATIPLDNKLEDAIKVARRIKSREGLRRQMQYIGKLMRTSDTEAIQQAMQQLEDGRKKAAEHFHELEEWRDRLIEQGPNSINQVMEKYPEADRQHLRQLVLQAIKEKKNNKPPAASRKLFRYLRELEL